MDHTPNRLLADINAITREVSRNNRPFQPIEHSFRRANRWKIWFSVLAYITFLVLYILAFFPTR